jgi:hypothetical protein
MSSSGKNYLKFQAFGVKIRVTTDKPVYLEEVKKQLEKVFPNGFEQLSNGKAEHKFFIRSKIDEVVELYNNEEKIFEGPSGENFYEMLESRIRVTIAEFAAGKVFLHAGVVGWKDRAIILPATSFAGKTTLVAELVKKGALYYSDEYAVLDVEGNVEPFPKWLSLRGIIDEYRQVDCPVESLGGIAGTRTIPVGLVLFARFDKAKKNPRNWKPESLSKGQGMMEILPHTLPIRNKPAFVLEVLNKLVSRAIIVKTVRGEAKGFAEKLLNYFESHIDKN